MTVKAYISIISRDIVENLKIIKQDILEKEYTISQAIGCSNRLYADLITGSSSSWKHKLQTNIKKQTKERRSKKNLLDYQRRSPAVVRGAKIRQSKSDDTQKIANNLHPSGNQPKANISHKAKYTTISSESSS
jgi:hypothetical protein